LFLFNNHGLFIFMINYSIWLLNNIWDQVNYF
jgi:hypothetical protein